VRTASGAPIADETPRTDYQRPPHSRVLTVRDDRALRPGRRWNPNITREIMLGDFKDRIADGMVVRSADGEKLGKVVACDASGFVIEKGVFFPKDFTATYGEILDVRDGEIYLARSRTEYMDWPREDLGDTARDTGAGMVEDLKEDLKTAGRKIKEAFRGDTADVPPANDTLRSTGTGGRRR
jgi:hypothetical protein